MEFKLCLIWDIFRQFDLPWKNSSILHVVYCLTQMDSACFRGFEEKSILPTKIFNNLSKWNKVGTTWDQFCQFDLYLEPILSVIAAFFMNFEYYLANGRCALLRTDFCSLICLRGHEKKLIQIELKVCPAWNRIWQIDLLCFLTYSDMKKS